jgi:hypothetical protein
MTDSCAIGVLKAPSFSKDLESVSLSSSDDGSTSLNSVFRSLVERSKTSSVFMLTCGEFGFSKEPPSLTSGSIIEP